MKNRNFLVEAATHAFKKKGAEEKIKQCYDEAVERFSLIHILNGMAHTEAVKAIDMIDDRGMRVHNTKVYLRDYEREIEKYENFMYNHMEHSAWVLLKDYIRVCWSCAEKELLNLKEACRKYLDKCDVDNSEAIAQCEVALLMWHIATDTFTLYFRSYKMKCGIDFSKDFSYANMDFCRKKWDSVTDEMSRAAKGLDFGNDKRCVECWQNLKEKIDNQTFFDKGAYFALKLNKGLLGKYTATMK